jgi:apolipoprotein N-acyltransferase
VLSGVLLGAAFLPRVPGFLAWGALVPLLAALERRVRARAPARALFGLGWLFGFVFFLIGTHWIALLSDVAITVPWLKYPAWVAAAAYLALYSGLVTLLAGLLARPGRAGGPRARTGLSLALVFPFAYLAVEELRASGELGFPWFQPGYTQQGYVPLIQMASLGSVSLVTLWLLVLNVLLWGALGGGGSGGGEPAGTGPGAPRSATIARTGAALGALLLVLLPWLWGARVLSVAGRSGPARLETPVALVQGNVAGEIKWSGRHQREILDTFLQLSEASVGRSPRPELILWPETATGSYLRKQLDQAIAVAAFASRTGVPVFAGFADYGFDSTGRQHDYNSAGLFAPGGGLGPSYAKRHLVPFGERMPFERLLPWLGRIELGQAEWTPGTGPVLFPSAAGPFSCLVCFEAIFPGLARDDVRAGARWLVNITNDEWFGNSAALYQHAAMAVFRAVENHVPLARCANTGLTLVADSHGRVVARLPVFRPDVLVATLATATLPPRPTPWTRWGDWPGLVGVVAIVAFAARAALRLR